MTRVQAIYTRQSIYKEDSLSIDTQIEKCSQNIDGNDYKIYNHDKGKSGKNIDRPSLQSLMNDIKLNKISKVYVYKLDRISRNVKDFYNLYDLMQEHGTEFCSVTESFDTGTSMGRAMMGILAVFAQLERENTVKRVTDNYYERIRVRGTWPGGPAPYGFINAKTEEKRATLMPNDEEIKAVIMAYHLYTSVHDISLAKTGDILFQNGFQSRKRKTFDNVTIARILQNPVYTKADRILYKYFQSKNANLVNEEKDWNGTLSCHVVGKRVGNSNIRKYTDLSEQTVYLTNFSGFIESRQYIAVQERLELNQQICRANKPSNMEELAGMIKCKKCGYAVKMYCKPYLSCYGNIGLKLCNASFQGVRLPHIQVEIGNRIQERLSDINAILLEQNNEINQTNKKIELLKKEIENIIQLVAMGGTTADIVKKQINEKQKKIYEYELNLQLMQNDLYHLSDTENYDRIEFGKMDLSKKKLVIREFIEKIELHESGDIEIYWKV